MFYDGDGLYFLTDGARLGLYHSSQGRKFIAVPHGSEGKRFLQNLAEAGRAGVAITNPGVISSKDELLAYFKRGRFLLLPGTQVVVAPTLFPQEDAGGFFLTFEVRSLGAKGNAKLSHVGDTLQLNVEDMLKMNGKTLKADDLSGFALVHFDAKKKFRHVCEVDFVLPELEVLNAEAQTLLGLMRKLGINDADRQKAEVLGHLVDFYGQPDLDAFNRWYELLGN